MPSLTLSDRLIWFAHCPKAGGTTIETLMVATWGSRVGHLRWGWDLWWRNGGWREADPPNSPQHLTWADAAIALDRAPDAAFALVRDPVARMASEHRYQRRLRRGTRAGRALALLPFALWLRVVLEMARRNPFAMDNHLRPQADFVPEGAAVFRLEEGIMPAIRWLSEATDCPLPPPEARLATAPDKRAARPVGAAERALIARAHHADYTRFGYPLPEDPPTVTALADRLARPLAAMAVWLDRRGRL